MSEELKRCPFCGSKRKPKFEHFISIDDSPVDSVMCEKCGIYFETYTRDDVDALTLWNTRPLEDEKDKEIKKLKEDLEVQKNLTRQACFESKRAYDETEKWKKMFYGLADKQATVDTNPKVVIVGKDINVLTNGTDNNVGSIKE